MDGSAKQFWLPQRNREQYTGGTRWTSSPLFPVPQRADAYAHELCKGVLTSMKRLAHTLYIFFFVNDKSTGWSLLATQDLCAFSHALK